MLNAILTGMMEACLGLLVITLLALIGILIVEVSNGFLPSIVIMCCSFSIALSVVVNVALYLRNQGKNEEHEE